MMRVDPLSRNSCWFCEFQKDHEKLLIGEENLVRSVAAAQGLHLFAIFSP